jgi:hypothetical protein
MLRKCTEQEFEKYIDFAYTLALESSKSGYPTYNDGIKTKEMFIERAKQAFSDDTEEILLFELSGTVEGWIHYYWIPEDRYLSTAAFNVRTATEEALREFLDFAEAKFPGYDLYLGYPAENTAAVGYLSANGFECIESDYNNTAFLDNLEPALVGGDIIPITKENYTIFREIHARAEADMYWNSDRIYDAFSNWTIFAGFSGGEPTGAIYYTNADDDWFEVFGIDFRDGVYNPELFRKLINAALTDAKARGGKYMTFFCEDEGQEILEESGFVCVGKYLCYKKHMKEVSML